MPYSISIEIITSNKELASICQLYWEVDAEFNFAHKVSDLAELAQVDKTKLSSVIQDTCNACVLEWKCEDCQKPYIFSNRTDLTNNKKLLLLPPEQKISFVCRDCGKKRKEKEIQEKKLLEEEAQKAKEILKEEKRKEIRDVYDLSRRSPIDIQSLTFVDTIYLTSVIRAGAYENLSKIMPIAMFEQRLSPINEFSTEIISHLHNNKLVYIHPDSDPEAFVIDDITRFYVWKVYYAPPISKLSPNDPSSIMNELLYRINAFWPEEWCQEAFSIWKKIAIQECIEFLIFVLQEHHFEFSPGEKTYQYISFALENFSTAQVFNTIWKAARDAAAYYQRGGISKNQAANAAIASIQKNTERAIAGNWDLKPFGRNFNCPQTIVSEVLYNSALKLGDEGLNLIPNLEIVRTKKLEQ